MRAPPTWLYPRSWKFGAGTGEWGTGNWNSGELGSGEDWNPGPVGWGPPAWPCEADIDGDAAWGPLAWREASVSSVGNPDVDGDSAAAATALGARTTPLARTFLLICYLIRLLTQLYSIRGGKRLNAWAVFHPLGRRAQEWRKKSRHCFNYHLNYAVVCCRTINLCCLAIFLRVTQFLSVCLQQKK